MNAKTLLAAATIALFALVGCGESKAPPAAQAPAAKGHDDHGGEKGHDDHGDEGGEALALTPAAREAAGLVVAPAGPATLVETVPLYGLIKPNAERMRSVTARFPGVVRGVSVKVGDTVRQGQALASVESNESLQVYAVPSPLGGVVTERFTNPGEQAESSPLFTVADLSTVWVELSLFPRDRGRVQIGQDVRVQATEGGQSADGKVVFVSPLSSSATQSLTARVLVDNSSGLWTPGLYVRGEVAVAATPVALAVPVAALQELENGTSVFVDTPGGLAPRVVKTGRNDGRHVEILDGISAGDAIVGTGSFVLKAELGKGEAEHDH
ncbi:MAG TPA: efflux RND transporter periplasmic adaptor subunit [Tahibacter sp.]|nr:efflux RND transporter periplasmic adaptor subunit [Tahibacter sp.]